MCKFRVPFFSENLGLVIESCHNPDAPLFTMMLLPGLCDECLLRCEGTNSAQSIFESGDNFPESRRDNGDELFVQHCSKCPYFGGTLRCPKCNSPGIPVPLAIHSSKFRCLEGKF